jgi:hypothetical protein
MLVPLDITLRGFKERGRNWLIFIIYGLLLLGDLKAAPLSTRNFKFNEFLREIVRIVFIRSLAPSSCEEKGCKNKSLPVNPF